MRRLGLARALPSDPAAVCPDIGQVYAAHFRYVWRCLRSLGVAEAQLDDAVHDVFLVVHRKLADFDGRARLTTWLYEICLRIARKYRSRSSRDARRHIADDPDARPSASDPAALEHGVDSNQRLALARAALDALPAPKREAFVLACVEQRSAPEIAEILGIPLNTVYSRIRAARMAFAAELERLGAPVGDRS